MSVLSSSPTYTPGFAIHWRPGAIPVRIYRPTVHKRRYYYCSMDALYYYSFVNIPINTIESFWGQCHQDKAACYCFRNTQNIANIDKKIKVSFTPFSVWHGNLINTAWGNIFVSLYNGATGNSCRIDAYIYSRYPPFVYIIYSLLSHPSGGRWLNRDHI